MELYDEELDCEVYHVGIHTMEELETQMAGPQEMVRQVYEVISSLLKQEKLVALLGGEHSLSIGAVQAYSERHPMLSVLQLDAHADLRDNYQGTPYSHASVMRRILEHAPAVQVGIRSLSREEMDHIRQEKRAVFFAHDLQQNDLWQEQVLERLTDKVYLTVDLDVLDPSIMPAVGTPEPGGLLWFPVLDLIRRVAREKEIVGFDIVELSPLPGQVAPDFLAARLAYKIIGYSLFP
jgi:agmatinase